MEYNKNLNCLNFSRELKDLRSVHCYQQVWLHLEITAIFIPQFLYRAIVPFVKTSETTRTCDTTYQIHEDSVFQETDIELIRRSPVH